MTASISLRRRFLSSGGWTLFARVTAALAGFGTNFIIARLLSPADVGVYFLLVSAATLVVTVSQGGLHLAVVRLAAEAIARGASGRARGAIEQTLRAGFGIAVLLGIAVAFGGSTVARLLNPASTLTSTTFGLLGAWIVALSLLGLTAESLRGLHEYKLAALLSAAIPNVLTLSVLGLLVAISVSVEFEVVLSAIVSVIVVTSLLGRSWMSGRLATLGPKEPMSLGDLLTVGWPLQVTSLAIFVMTQVDIWLVGAFCSTGEVALYGAAARLLALVVMPMVIGNVILQPLVADLHSRGEPLKIQRLVRTTATLSGGVAVSALLAVCLAAEPILELAYGDYYRDAALALVVLCTGQTINVLAGPGAIVLMMSGGQRQIMVISLVCGILLAICGSMAVNLLGIVGVAAAAAVANALHGLLCLVAVRRRNGIWVFADPLELIRALRTWRSATQ